MSKILTADSSKFSFNIMITKLVNFFTLFFFECYSDLGLGSEVDLCKPVLFLFNIIRLIRFDTGLFYFYVLAIWYFRFARRSLPTGTFDVVTEFGKEKNGKRTPFS